MPHVLPDVLEPGLLAVFCGSAAGRTSASRSAYYAHPRNRFWPTLAEVGLTPRVLRPEEFPTLPRFGLGLTDVVKVAFGNDAELPREHFDVHSFREKMRQNRPKIIAFNGLTSARAVLGSGTAIGRAKTLLEGAVVFVCPSTSPGNCDPRHWDVAPWREVAREVESIGRLV